MKNEDVGFKKVAANETSYAGGAHRDSRAGKGAPEWMPSQALALVSCIYELGNKGRSKSGDGEDRNWENGMKIGDLLGSAKRHIERYLEGDRSEPHLPQAAWNILNAIQMGIWVTTGYRDLKFNNLADHINPWKPGDPPPPTLSLAEIDWLKLRGLHLGTASQMTTAYLAALIDGEGTITIVQYDPPPRETYRLNVHLWNTNEALLRTVKSRFGGYLHIHSKGNTKHATGWVLTWTCAAAAEILKQIQPLLIVKAAQAELGLRLSSIVSGMKPGCKGTPRDVVDTLREMKIEINRLNLKGPQKSISL